MKTLASLGPRRCLSLVAADGGALCCRPQLSIRWPRSLWSPGAGHRASVGAHAPRRRESPWARDRTHVPSVGRWVLELTTRPQGSA